MKIIGALAIVTAAQQAAAFTTWECLNEDLKWSSNSITMRYSSVSFPSGSWRSSLDTAINRVNQNPTPFRINKSYNDNSVGVDNGQNEAWFTSNQSLLDGAPARAFVQFDCIDYWIFGKDVEITEADVIFDVGESYTTSMSKANLWSHGGPFRPFQTTAIHELGHGSGLGHTSNTYNIMGSDWTHIATNGNTARSYLGEDAAHGLVSLYGQSSSGAQDVGISQFKRTGASGEYSVHSPTTVRSSTGGALATRMNGTEVGYRVNRGQTVRLELTYENNGRTNRTEDVGFYVSSNNLISTYDTRIAGTSYSLNRNTVYTTSRTVTIPTNLTRNRFYYLGALIDENGSLAEMTEANNAARIPIWIN